MAVQDMMKTITDRLGETASVKRVFGDPTTVGHKTIIPIATVGIGFGGGAGKGKGHADTEEPSQEGEGGGGGGKGITRPLAVLEVTEEETKLIPVVDLTRVILSGIFMLGAMTFMITRLIGSVEKHRRT